MNHHYSWNGMARMARRERERERAQLSCHLEAKLSKVAG